MEGISISQDDIAKTITLNFPLESIPSDEEIHLTTLNGVLDNSNARTIDIIRFMSEIVVERYPASDEEIYHHAPQGYDPQTRETSLGPREVPVDHNCGDPNCPHLKGVDPFEALLSADFASHRELDLSKWEPFKYPILAISNEIWPALGGIIDMSQMRRHFNLLRVASGFQIDTSKSSTFTIPLSYDIVEAIYFWNTIPKTIELQSNGCPGPVLKPERKYSFIGMALKAPYSRSQIVFEENTGVYDFAVIAWVCTSERMYRDMKKFETTTNLLG